MKNKNLSQRQQRQKEYLKKTALSTQAIRSGTVSGLEQEHNDAIYATSSFIYGSAEEACECFSGQTEGNIYSRFTNPTVRTFEQRIALMEGGARAVAASSGMAALTSIFLGHLKQGDHIVSSCSIFGSIVGLFDNVLTKLGITTTYVSPVDSQAWQDAIQPNTKALFLESPSNPLGEVGDIAALATLAHSHNALLVVDNCFCTPILQNPLALGADIVMHSATKYIDGQGRCVGGVAIGSEEHMEPVFGFLRTVGTCMSPFNAWVFINGLETLSLRMQAHCSSALKLAHWLQEQPQVERVYYPGLESHPQHQLAKQQQRLFGAVVSFEVRGDRTSAWRCIDDTQLLSITGNFGDAKSTITHPATTTHSRMTAAARALAGIKDNLIRVSVGLEDYEDIKQDLAQALSKL
ncbi:O-succinylhomoserine sulfhydrylase [Candidatus Njordibacter sp. Uisw_039]|jgi:O-succinylhomoserine sulfhydrylase|uniref:O-succinylhomoserine sulfhydrylase n=1 Tax=Candidatus Njordibacter sp. Uisw_039 TaxID=3230972 RepID=UPI003A2091A7|tara:strand:- start:9096 stop:10316 length:1221 start_codon:yes stop_codon:yes gene_type:complete